MAWTKVDEIYIRNYTTLVVGLKMKIEDVTEKYQEEVQKRVDAWFTAEALATQQATKI